MIKSQYDISESPGPSDQLKYSIKDKKKLPSLVVPILRLPVFAGLRGSRPNTGSK